MWDGLIFGIPSFLLQIFLLFLTGMQSMSYIVLLAIVVVTIYMNGVKGGTPGKLMLGLRIQNEERELIGIPGAMLRYVGSIISTLTLGIGYIMIAFTEKKQGLHDKIAGTFVVRKPGVKRTALFVIGIILGFLPLLAIPFLIIGFAGLAFFGVLNAEGMLPESCTFPEGVMCEDFKAYADGRIVLTMVNNKEAFKDVTLTLENECAPKLTDWALGESVTFTCTGRKGEARSKYNQNINLAYTSAGLKRTMQGYLITKYA